MFERKKIPDISVEEVVSFIKKSYQTDNRGYVSYITENYIIKSVAYEKEYQNAAERFHEIKAVKTVDRVDSKIATFFYTNKIIGNKIGNISSNILINSGGICAVCDSHADTLDHVLPKSKYVQYTITPINLVPLCSRCNRVKKDKVTNQNKIIFHPYFHDYGDMHGLVIDYKIRKNIYFSPSYKLGQNANISFKYNFEEVFKFNEVLSSLAGHEIIKLSRILINKTELSKKQVQEFLKTRKDGLMDGLDPQWKILLYELLIKEFDVFYEYEVLIKRQELK